MDAAGKIVITVCVGSSCHIRGARHAIDRFSELMKEHSLEDRVFLKGSFCMERCGKGINWQIDDEYFTSSTVEDAEKIFNEKILAGIEVQNGQ